MNPLIFGTGFVFAFTHKGTNPVPKITGFITKPNTLNTTKEANTLNPNTLKSGIFCCVNGFVFSESDVWGAKVAPDLRGCPPGKRIRMRAILKENTTNYISLERLPNVDFEKKILIAGFFNSAKENPKQPRK